VVPPQNGWKELVKFIESCSGMRFTELRTVIGQSKKGARVTNRKANGRIKVNGKEGGSDHL